MEYLVYELINRLSNGERVRLVESGCARYWFGALFLVPLLIWDWAPVYEWIAPYTDQSPWILWAAFIVGVVLFSGLAVIWIKVVPAWISFLLAIVAWMLLFAFPPSHMIGVS